jgi:polyisoprenoid-binding protein YceI
MSTIEQQETTGTFAADPVHSSVGFEVPYAVSTFRGEITMKGITRPVTLTGTITGPAVDHFGATRVGLELETTVDRTEFDMKWNMPLPNGEPALSNEVTLKADLTLVAQEA